MMRRPPHHHSPAGNSSPCCTLRMSPTATSRHSTGLKAPALIARTLRALARASSRWRTCSRAMCDAAKAWHGMGWCEVGHWVVWCPRCQWWRRQCATHIVLARRHDAVEEQHERQRDGAGGDAAGDGDLGDRLQDAHLRSHANGCTMDGCDGGWVPVVRTRRVVGPKACRLDDTPATAAASAASEDLPTGWLQERGRAYAR